MDDTGFDSFYTATSTRVARQLYLLVGDLSEAEDIANEAYERAWQRWRHVQTLDNPEAWVRTVARRVAVSRWRRARRLLFSGNVETARPVAGPNPDHVALMAALRSLPERQRTAIVLHHLVDLPIEQVANETGASVAAVKQQLSRGRKALAVVLLEPAYVEGEKA